MKSKAEKNVEKAFEEMDVTPYTYHIREYGEHRRRLRMFDGITIVSDVKCDSKLLANAVGELDRECESRNLFSEKSYSDYIGAPASWMRKKLADGGCFGVAICDYRDQFSRKRGRIIAEGRLLKELRRNG